MDFFAEQRIRNRRSLWLYGLFIVIILAHMVVALSVMALLLTIFSGSIYYWVMMLVVCWILLSFMGGSFFEYRRLRAGGRAIAQRVGAIRLFIDSSHDAWEHSSGVAHQHKVVSPVRYSTQHIAVRNERDFPPVYRRYYEFAQQLAIASGIRMPVLYVLSEEQGINGFVAGRHSNDMVLVITQGALDKLSDEALYGLIGHEYGHILHGDAHFNLKLMVVLAGLQILYDWSDPIDNSQQNNRYDRYESLANRDNSVSQSIVDNEARIAEQKTAHFTTHSEWVTHWQQHSQHPAFNHSAAYNSSIGVDRTAPRSVWTLLLHGLSFLSMASAQLIKHSFNRERELLADATSVQLTRSPAIIETLKAIHQDSLGSRLSNVADMNGLSHFFFASSGSDFGDVSWFATHPSLSERMSAINASEYQAFALQLAKQKRLNQQKIKEIYEQRRRGTWNTLKENSLSNNMQNDSRLSNSTINTRATQIKNTIPHESVANSNEATIAKIDTDLGLEFTIEKEIVINGRLQIMEQDTNKSRLLKPWQAITIVDLPSDKLISDLDINRISLPHYLLNHSYHPLGAQALIEAVLLCHQGFPLSTSYTYSLSDIWGEMSEKLIETGGGEAEQLHNNQASTNQNQAHARLSKNYKILPHTIDSKLLEIVAKLDRRLDSALIALALKQLHQHDLSEPAITKIQRQSEHSHQRRDHLHYQTQLKSRTMLLSYQQGLMKMFDSQITADLTDNFERDQSSQLKLQTDHSQKPPILSLWQSLHLQQLLPVLNKILDDKASVNNLSCPQISHDVINSLYAQLDPSAETFGSIHSAERMMLIIFAYRLANNRTAHSHSMLKPLTTSLSTTIIDQILSLRRHMRLIDVDLIDVSDANLQWLLLTAQQLNSCQLLAILQSVAAFTTESEIESIAKDKRDKKPPSSGRIAYNTYRLWLSTLHTAMLHDTIISQDEYDCLSLLAERWLNVRQLFE